MRSARQRLVVTAFVLLAAGCQRGGDPAAGTGAEQTQFPGQVTAGGATSGDAIEQAKGADAKDLGAARQAGTPGIPEGSGGTTGGARLGGTVAESALGGTGRKSPAQQPPAGASAPAAASAPLLAASAAALAAERQKQQLDERMTRVAERWRSREREGRDARPAGAVPVTPPASAATR